MKPRRIGKLDADGLAADSSLECDDEEYDTGEPNGEDDEVDKARSSGRVDDDACAFLNDKQEVARSEKWRGCVVASSARACGMGAACARRQTSSIRP